ncbi:MAG: rRNA adenine dimethyltransferase family protein [archaeon]
MDLFEQLQDMMIKYHFRPEKKLSQFFCINEALLVFLANSAKIEKKDVVLEIGAGTGFMTRKLLDKAKKVGAKVIAVEMDEYMCEILSKEFSAEIEAGELKLINANALEQDFGALGVTKIVALPPYHISSELVTKISLAKGLAKVILVLDRGFVEKLTAFEGLSEYVALTVLVNLNSKVEILENNIAPQSFFPPPNCKSTVVGLDFNVKNNSNEFYAFLHELFRHKKKDLARSLKQSFQFLSKELGWKEKDFNAKLKTLKLSSTKVYLLSPKEFLEVFVHFNSKSADKKDN